MPARTPRGEALQMRRVHGSSKGMPPRADAGSNPANPSSDAIANGAIARL
jgi:hypothetical protein